MKDYNLIDHKSILDLFISLIEEIDNGYNCVSNTISMSPSNGMSWRYNSGNDHYISFDDFSTIPGLYDGRMLSGSNMDEYIISNRETIQKLIKLKAFL